MPMHAVYDSVWALALALDKTIDTNHQNIVTETIIEGHIIL